MKYLIILLLLSITSCAGSNKELSVYVFLGTECPLSQEQTFNIRQAQLKWKDQVNIYAVFPNESDAGPVMEEFARKYELDCTLIADPQHKLVKSLNASVTPEVFLLSGRGKVLYSGQIDNRMPSFGVKRKVVTDNYLDQAISEALAGKSISVTNTKAVGCSIFHKL